MVIVSKDKTHIVNFNFVSEVFMGFDGCKINVNYSNGGGCMIDRYPSQESARAAMEMLCNAIGSTEKFNMPSDELAEKNIDRGGCSSSYRNGYHGAKPIRHGGS